MGRKVPIIALFVLGLQVCEILILGTSRSGSLVANSLQMIACVLATAMALGASQRGRGLSRPFWLMISAGLATWGIANLGWMYYENWLHQEIPTLSITRVLFDTEGVFFAIALFLDKDRDSPCFDTETALDALQVGIVFFSAFFGMYYVQLLSGGVNPYAEKFMTWSYLLTNSALTALAFIIVSSLHTERLRRLYGGLALFLTMNTVCSGIDDWMQSVNDVPTGTWYDFGWSVPFLVCAVWAAQWKEAPEESTDVIIKGKTPRSVAFKNVALGLAPLLVLLLVARLGTEWRGFGFVLVALSIACYAAQLGLVQYREGKTAAAIRRHQMAMDSAMDSMAMVSPEGKYTYVNDSFVRMLGYTSADEILGKSWDEVNDPRDLSSIRNDMNFALA